MCECCLPSLALRVPGAPCAGTVGVRRWIYPTWIKSGPIALPVTPLVGARQGVGPAPQWVPMNCQKVV